MAEDRVQPEPWLLGLSTREARYQWACPCRHSRSSASRSRWPPFTSTPPGRALPMASAARSMASSSPMAKPHSRSASGMLGVITSARGNSSSIRAVRALSCIRLEPLVATITGSTTMCSARYSRSLVPMARMMSALDTMPIFTASGRMSRNTQSSCCATNSGVASSTPDTPVVFWAVRAVMALMPYTPRQVMVFRSAWIPAPPLESLPAMVSTFFIHMPPLFCRQKNSERPAERSEYQKQTPWAPGPGCFPLAASLRWHYPHQVGSGIRPSQPFFRAPLRTILIQFS